MDQLKTFESFRLNELDQPSHIKLHHPEQQFLGHIDNLYNEYMELIRHMEANSMPEDKIAPIRMKAKKLLNSLKVQ